MNVLAYATGRELRKSSTVRRSPSATLAANRPRALVVP
jgi:hypothetical protein